jgi:hypothetical protein
MGEIPTGVAAFDAVAARAEQARQSSQAAASANAAGRQGPEPPITLQASIRASDIAYYKALLASAVQNGLSTSAAISALRELNAL